jgi:outer membrane murein-binding lipoprotein Lpp
VTPDAQLAAATWALLGVTLAGIFISGGILIAKVGGLQAAVKAVHRRIDELEANHQAVREVLAARQILIPQRSAPSRPPILLRDDEEEDTPA